MTPNACGSSEAWRQATNKRRGVLALEAIVIAGIIAVPMVSYSWNVMRMSEPTFSRKVFLWLNAPAQVIWAGSGGENDSSRIVLRCFVLLQWIVIGIGAGYLVAVLRRAIKEHQR